MATTCYATINGQILYETTNGVRTEYVHDALGSVIATTDASRNVQNTYRWAGYSTQIAKTGTGSDPRFLWVGIEGYRSGTHSLGGVYVRRRHHTASLGAWSSPDPIFATERPGYRYCRSNPIGRTDPRGLLSAHPCQPVNKKDCGFAETMFKWYFTVPADKIACGTGPSPSCYIVQHVTTDHDVYCCPPAKRTIPIDCGGAGGIHREYWEVWGLSFDADNQPTVSSMMPQACVSSYVGCDDWFRIPAGGAQTERMIGLLNFTTRYTKGESKIVKTGELMANNGHPGLPGHGGDWQQGIALCGPGCLYYVTTFPNWGSVGSSPYCHIFRDIYKCCCTPAVTQGCQIPTVAWDSPC